MTGYDKLTGLYALVVPSSLAKKREISHLHTLPDSEIIVSVNIDIAWEEKMKAIYCHRTQIGETSILTASEEKQRLFFGKEHFAQLARHNGCDFFSELLRSNACV